MQPEHRADLENLVSLLRSGGLSADLQITEYDPGRRGISFNQAEAVAIYIGGAMTVTVIANLTNDIYDRVKNWAIARFLAKVKNDPNGLHRPETFTIYGPDNEILKSWTIDDGGEHES